MRILVTGATGKVGRHLAAQLHGSGHTVRALTRNPASAELPAGIEAIAGDLTDINSLEAAFEGMDAIHLITFGGEGEDLTNGTEIVRLAERSGISPGRLVADRGRGSPEGQLHQLDHRATGRVHG